MPQPPLTWVRLFFSEWPTPSTAMPSPPLPSALLPSSRFPEPTGAESPMVMPSPPLVLTALLTIDVVVRELADVDAGAERAAGVVGLDPVAARLAHLDPALAGAEIVAAHDGVAGQIQDDAGAIVGGHVVEEDAVAGRVGDADAATALLDDVALDEVEVGGEQLAADGDAEADVGRQHVADDRVAAAGFHHDGVAAGAGDLVVLDPGFARELDPDAVLAHWRPGRCRG